MWAELEHLSIAIPDGGVLVYVSWTVTSIVVAVAAGLGVWKYITRTR